MDRYVATFEPQKWFNDHAFPVEPPGVNEWDCTNFLRGLPADVQDQIIRDVDAEGVWLDLYDRFRNDPFAPAWIGDWDGPFTITVCRKEI